MSKQEAMVVIQGKVPRNVKERIKLLIQERGISESEFLRGLAEDYLNGSGKGTTQNGRDSKSIEPKLDELKQQMRQLRVSLSNALELIMNNLIDDPVEVRSLIQNLQSNKKL